MKINEEITIKKQLHPKRKSSPITNDNQYIIEADNIDFRIAEIDGRWELYDGTINSVIGVFEKSREAINEAIAIILNS